VPPRASVTDYPAHDSVLGAAIVPASQVSKVFSGAVAKDYIVVEVAVFPENAQSLDLVALDFALNTGSDNRCYPATPEEAAWHGQKQPGIPAQGPRVVTEVGVVVGTRTDPVTGRAEHGVATYGGVGVDNRPPPPAPSASASPAGDPYAIEGRLRRMALPGGQTDRPIAGYLYFPKVSSKKTASLEYSQNGVRKELALPLK
jgi:hypothetical protein